VQAPALAQDRLKGARFTGAGAQDVATFDVCSVVSDKSRLALAHGAAGFHALAWTDERSDAGDVYAQSVLADGSLGAPATGVPAVAPSVAGLVLGAPRPNPSRGPVRFDFSVPPGAVARFGLFDVAGRAVRPWATVPDGSGSLVWDGREASGRRAAAGVYFARLTAGGELREARVLRVH
jgi:hypothetical protein